MCHGTRSRRHRAVAVSSFLNGTTADFSPFVHTVLAHNAVSTVLLKASHSSISVTGMDRIREIDHGRRC